MYEKEMHDPTGIRVSLPRPPNYWEGKGIGGVLIADQCGWAFGLEGGKGVQIDEFWSRSINCELANSLLSGGEADARRCICYGHPTAGPDPSCPSNGGHTYSIDSGKGLAVDHCHYGHHRQLDLFGTRRGGDHVGEPDKSAHARPGIPVFVLGYRFWTGELRDLDRLQGPS